ncbi:MAG TPA: DEAD/DEAH box helicase [Streptosporangiaceae bacterium]|nr:DEAD/DEAH box helicase [Streptosporangiaceae bacterium]
MPNTPARRRTPAHYRRAPRRKSYAGPQTTGRQSHADEARSELDQALAAAAELPQSRAVTFGELGLDDRIVRALAARDITVPFAIQARALPDAIAGRDVLGRAETGSGKTLAFGLPMLSRMAALAAIAGRPRAKAPRGLVLVPTRELAEQLAGVLRPLGRCVGLLITTVYGGVPIGRQVDRLSRGVDIVVATPGRLIDLLDRGACTLSDVDVTVLDEADHMADLGFLPSVTQIMDQTPAGGQRLLFSATLDRGVDKLVRAYLSDPALHAIQPQVVSGGAAQHSMLVLDPADKVAVAAEMAGRPARTLFFVRTKQGADRLARQLDRAGVQAAAIHGDRNQNQRQRALDAFAAGHPRVLVATDVAARGIHVDDVELVVHFDPPNDHKDYLHRSGRTARAGATGMVVTLAQRDQLRELQRLHAGAGVKPARHDGVTASHPTVRQIAATGTPVSPPVPAPKVRPRPADAPARVRRKTGPSGNRRSRQAKGMGRPVRPSGRTSRDY